MISFSEAGQRMPTLKRLAATAHEEYATVHVEHGAISYESWCFRKAHNDYQTDIHISRCVAFLIPNPISLRQPLSQSHGTARGGVGLSS